MNPLAGVFGVELADDERDAGAIWRAIEAAESRGGAEFARAATREALRQADAHPPHDADAMLAGLWPGWRARRRGWRALRRHLHLPRLALPEILRALALLPSLAAGAWLIGEARPDLSGAVFQWAPIALINLMLIGLAERACGWRFPRDATRVADLERRLRDSPHDHPWTSDGVRRRVAELVTTLDGPS